MKSFYEFCQQVDEAKARLGAPRTDPRFGIDVLYTGVRRAPDGHKIRFTGPKGEGEEFIADAEPIRKESLSDPQLQGMAGVAIKFTTQDGTVYRTVMPLPQWRDIKGDLDEKKYGSYGRIAGQQMQQAARPIG